MNQVDVGKIIKEARINKQMTQQQLADKLGVTDRAVSNWENGIRMPDYSLLSDLCLYLDLDINEILNCEKLAGKKVRIINKGNEKKKISYKQTINDESLLTGEIVQISKLNKCGLIKCVVENINIIIEDDYKIYTLDVKDDSDFLTGIVITKDDKELQNILDCIQLNDECLVYGILANNKDIFAIKAIKKAG